MGVTGLDDETLENAISSSSALHHIARELKDKNQNTIILQSFCSEGDNRPDAHRMAQVITSYLKCSAGEIIIRLLKLYDERYHGLLWYRDWKRTEEQKWAVPVSWIELEMANERINDRNMIY